MPEWIQHVLVLLAAAGALAFVLRGAYASLRGRRSRLGSCCDKGCGAARSETPERGADRVVFLPLDALRLKRRRE